MPDYKNYQPPAFAGPQFPFSRALTSGPVGDLLAGVAGVPGDISQIAYPRTDPRFASIPTAPTYEQIKAGMAEQNAQPAELSYSTLWSMLPELSMMLRGAPTADSVRPWAKNLLASGAAPAQPTGNAQPPSTSDSLGQLFAYHAGLPGGAVSMLQHGLNDAVVQPLEQLAGYAGPSRQEMDRRYAEIPTLFPTSARVMQTMGVPQPSENQGWSVQRMFRDLVGGSQPAY